MTDFAVGVGPVPRPKSVRASTRLKLSAALIALAAAAPALAQTVPTFRSVDANGIDVVNGDVVFAFEEGSIGDGQNRLSIVRRSGGRNATQWDGYRISRAANSQNVTITTDTTSTLWTFNAGTGTFSSGLANGQTLVRTGNEYVLTNSDGSRIRFAPTSAEAALSINVCWQGNTQSCVVEPIEFVAANGLKTTLTHDTYIMQTSTYNPQIDDYVITRRAWWRIRQITRTADVYVRFNYQSDATPPAANTQPSQAWLTRANAVFGANLSSVSYTYPVAGAVVVTDQRGNPWRIEGGGFVMNVRRPGSATDTFTLTQPSSNNWVVTNEGLTTTYSRVVSGTTATMTISHPGGGQTVVTSDINVGRPSSVRDPLNRTTTYTYDANRRLTRVTYPEGNYVQFTLDSRGNVTEERRVAKAGSGAPDIVTTASYPASCSNILVCNKPDWTRDARGNQTDYTYDGTHGGLLTVTLPAAPNGVRPQTRYSYTTVSNVPVLTGVSLCRSTASCVGTADETRTTIAYNTSLLPTSVTQAAGDNSLTRTAIITYDGMGNRLTVDGPLPGTADTTRYRYDAARNLVGVVSADPDGTGPLQHQAVRTTYNVDGNPTLVEQGRVADQSDTSWAGFVSLRQQAVAYDANARKVTESIQAGGTTFALTQYSYDARGRVECTAVRMNPAVYGSLPGACTLGTQGSFGPDRITRNSFDAADQLTRVQTAVGTADQSDEMTLTYTANGTQATASDGNNNLTTYVYDGHDRLSQTRFPSAANGAVSSTTDFEGLTYDAAGNVTQRRLRDGQVIGYAYDALNRVTTKTMPDPNQTVSYTYDLTGQMRTAWLPNGLGAWLAYDAFGNLLRQDDSTGGWDRGARYTGYDQRGLPTVFSYAGRQLLYSYDVLGRMISIANNFGVPLAQFTYDDLGQRTTVTRGNSPATTSYGYDGIGRLTSLSHNLDGSSTAWDVSTSFAYNPASQIISQTMSNDAYAWTNHFNVDRPYGVNGLNQFTSAGAASFSYDGRGNLTSDGALNLVYDPENKLTAASGAKAASLLYDPLGRLVRVSNGNAAAATWFVYDGDKLVAEHDAAGNMLRFYVHGPGVDEPLAWFDNGNINGVFNPAERHDLFANAQGSVVAIANGNGTTEALNRYDEFGIPAPTNLGRFQYTGQAWSPELGMYHYKARTYSPTLGRFLQADPIGYGDGMNMYNYVGGDPVNRVDPSGLAQRYNPYVKRIEPKPSWGADASDPPEDPELTVTCCRRLLPANMQIVGVSGFGIGGGGGGGGSSVALPALANQNLTLDKSPRIGSDQPCNAVQRAAQDAGKFVVDIGGGVTNVGLGVAGVGTALAIGGALWLNPAAVLIGGAAIADGSTAAAAGGLITTGGAILMAAGGSGKEGIKELATRAIARPIPAGYGKDIMSKLIGDALDVVLPEVQQCRR